ncbi:NADP-dependent oxidoreductase [uncultured Actinomyces sp.]|uniref:NADP-dependent oxidoreductase n=1 Tax=uncultured Actinomyces sp. TaxID=249061 RepID=UPI0028DCBAC7|nr:NADP-dependent oxidoreductase [uncultured Actinomyces sp.]
MTRAIQYQHFGGPEVLEMADVIDTAPGPHQVRVSTRAAGLNPVDWKVFSGMIGKDASHLPQGVGHDFSGVVSAIGSEVSNLAVGDAVFGTLWAAPGQSQVVGALSEQVVVSADEVLRKPEALGFTEAAVLGIVALTASGALRTLALTSDDVLVVSAASGGVGSLAVQLATHRGVPVIGIASERNADYLRSLGAVPVAYGAGLASRIRSVASRPVTKLLDCHGPEYVDLALSLGLAPEAIGTLVPSPEAIAKGVHVTGMRHAGPADLKEVADLVAGGVLKIQVAHVYPFDVESVRSAYTTLREGHVRGKLVVTIA